MVVGPHGRMDGFDLLLHHILHLPISRAAPDVEDEPLERREAFFAVRHLKKVLVRSEGGRS